jgi:RHS repeat-associated protein
MVCSTTPSSSLVTASRSSCWRSRAPNRTATKTDNAGQAGEKTTSFDYLGLSDDVVNETVAGQLQRSYQYSPWGERLSQTKFNAGGSSEESFYGYNPHTDVETLTDQNGDTRATYGYTASGQNDDSSFTGVDKPDPQDPTREPYNFYRFNGKRFDPASGTYDMGFRDYDPGLNRYLTRDTYNGALADLKLTTDPFTGNRYAFAGGNPITGIELDGHVAQTLKQLECINGGSCAPEYTFSSGGGAAVGGGSGGGGRGEVPYGSQQGAEALRQRAEQLQGLRVDDPGGTTAVVRVYNKRTGRYEVWVTVNRDVTAEEAWGKNSPLSGDEVFKQGEGHAEKTVVNNLGDDYEIVEGGTSRNVCEGTCRPLLAKRKGLYLGGIPRPGTKDKTPWRTFWRLRPGTRVAGTPVEFGRIFGRALSVLNLVGLALDVYNYFHTEKPLMDRGWQPCMDPKTGTYKIPISLCPPGSNGGPVA